MSIHQKMVIFFEKMMKAYFKMVILSIKTDGNKLKFNFLMGAGRGAVRHIDCLSKFFKVVLYRCKKR